MSRYIDADALKEKYTMVIKRYSGGIMERPAVLLETIDEAPTIDIVRCKECMWRDKDNQGEDYCTYAKGLADINDDSFCSWGERREI